MSYPPIPMRVRIDFRERMSGRVLRDVDALMESEGFIPVPVPEGHQPSGQRRTRAQEYLDGIEWDSQDHRQRFLRVLEQVIDAWQSHGDDPILMMLQRDGYVRDDRGRSVPAIDGRVLDLPTETLDDPGAIEEQLDRIVRSRNADAGQTIEASRALLEATCKLVLRRHGRWPGDLGDSPTLPALLTAAFETLDLHPRSVDNERWPGDVVAASRRTLGGLMSSIDGLAQLRNLIAHGQDHPTTLPLRWGHLAANSAAAVCWFLLETLAGSDPETM